MDLVEHVVEKRRLTKAECGWRGYVSCSCGWTAEVGPSVAALLVHDELGHKWADHGGDGRQTVQAAAG